jgi:glyoxylase-like metal-dependent hydrolase (beta-lactamase superfamily II)
MLFRQLFDAESSTYTYLLADEVTREAILIDPVLGQLERDLEVIQGLGLTLVYALDTHVHADHVTALGSLRERLGARMVISERSGVTCADLLVKDGDALRFGAHRVDVLETPGHTAGCVTYVTGDRAMAFTGDALLIRGCGRTDFQGGDAHRLFRSIHGKLFTLPAQTVIYPGHDYHGRTMTTVDEERRLNPRLGGGRTEDEFVAIMGTLALARPRKIDVALPRNARCGRALSGEHAVIQPRATVATAGPEVAP